MKHGFIGFGNLGKAIYFGLKNNNEEDSFGYVSRNNLHTEITSFENISKLTSFAEVIWICVKPQELENILKELKTSNIDNKLIISCVAGKNINYIKSQLNKDVDILRIMPNLAIAYNKSIIAYHTNNVNSILVNHIKIKLKNLGEIVELPEKNFDLFTAIFGSGPAFLLTIMKSIKEKINELNLSEEQTNKLLLELINGTNIYFENNKEKTIEELILNITSKGGTTEAGLNYLKEQKIDKLFLNVITEAEKKSKEITEKY